ncbi:hypothetical protein LEP1GSC186_4442 [Leptospira noguchii serovar Autumnalis str. ZUN142]|uniref:Uncharacterized protein n=1 Tax=Leptospira noguchii serovar Autumnalis str. ZUN142 TaxID=1085540 RepID=M6U482_9LEPT|nr:hypothetical protein LEP1GSC186_4442 [Leptospira noguchii serovar Autumnalis str. ZUN142]
MLCRTHVILAWVWRKEFIFLKKVGTEFSGSILKMWELIQKVNV